jgi:hypothetical protein
METFLNYTIGILLLGTVGIFMHGKTGISLHDRVREFFLRLSGKFCSIDAYLGFQFYIGAALVST